MGVCPQHDVLWPSLTVREHLELYATLKGVPAAEVGADVQASLLDIGLADKEHARARALSGGMTRDPNPSPHISPLYLPYISPISHLNLELPSAAYAAQVLPYISPISPPYLT